MGRSWEQRSHSPYTFQALDGRCVVLFSLSIHISIKHNLFKKSILILVVCLLNFQIPCSHSDSWFRVGFNGNRARVGWLPHTSCVLAACLLYACCMLDTCFLRSCCFLAVGLLRTCCGLAAGLLRACCGLAACVLLGAAGCLHAFFLCASFGLLACLLPGCTRGSHFYAYGSSPSSC